MNIQYHSFKGTMLLFGPHEDDIALAVLEFLYNHHESEEAQEQLQAFIDAIKSGGGMQ